MTGSAPKKEEAAAKPENAAKTPGQETERLEDEEKILAGRHDVNFPALLTKDVPGG